METPDQVESAKFSADGELIALGVADGSARLYRTGETRSFLAVRHPKPPTPADEFEDEPSTIVFDAEFSADGTLLVTASGDKTARVWEVTTGKLVSVFRGHGSELSAATFSPDGTTVASVADSGAPRLWDARTGRARVRLRGRAGLAGSPSFSPDGSRLLTVEDKTVRIRDVRTGAIVLELRIPAAIVGQAGARFSHDGRFVVAGDSGSVRVWDAVRGRDVETFVGGGEEGVDISRDDAFVLGSRADSSAVYACELCRPLDKLLETARRRVHRTLTADERRTYLHE